MGFGKDSKQCGVTLIELMVVILIAGVVLGLAAPNFSQQIESTARRSVESDFMAAMAYARAESVKRGSDVFLRTVSNNQSWQEGWCVTVSNTCGANDIRRFDPVDSVSFKSTDNSTTAFAFNSQGFLASNSASVSICQKNAQGKKITVTPIGQALSQDCTCSNSAVCGG